MSSARPLGKNKNRDKNLEDNFNTCIRIRICIRNTDQDPATQLNTDPYMWSWFWCFGSRPELKFCLKYSSLCYPHKFRWIIMHYRLFWPIVMVKGLPGDDWCLLLALLAGLLHGPDESPHRLVRPVFRIHRIRMFLGLPGPDPLVRGTASDPVIFKQK